MSWIPPNTVEELARVAAGLGPDAKQIDEPVWGDEKNLPHRDHAERLVELSARLGVEVDRDGAVWTARVPAIGAGQDQLIQAPSLATMCDALADAVRRRNAYISQMIGDALAVLSVYWHGIYLVGWNEATGELWSRRGDGLGGIMTAMTPEELNKMMADWYAGPPR